MSRLVGVIMFVAALTSVGALQCYSCIYGGSFTGGCGGEFDVTSTDVTIVNCSSSCYSIRSSSANGSHVVYGRRCDETSTGTHENNSCEKGINSLGGNYTSCYCSTDLCNDNRGLTPTAPTIPAPVPTTLLECYSCETMGIFNANDGCGDDFDSAIITRDGQGLVNCTTSCQTMREVNRDGVAVKYHRSCVPEVSVGAVQPDTCSDIEGEHGKVATWCYCNTDRCNNNDILTEVVTASPPTPITTGSDATFGPDGLRTLQCYSCTTASSGDEENSCGVKFDPTSNKVTIVNCNTSCQAIGTASFGSPPFYQYVRGCAKNIMPSKCSTSSPDLAEVGQVCHCNSNLCNSNDIIVHPATVPPYVKKTTPGITSTATSESAIYGALFLGLIAHYLGV